MTSRLQLSSFADSPTLARAVATRWLDELAARAGATNPYCVALSGGRIAKELFAAVANEAKARAIKLDGVEFFWGDERCVPPDHVESNFRPAAELLLAPLGVRQNQIHRVKSETDADFAAAEAEAELCRLAPLNDDGQPVLDLIFLGLGEDGHVASLFPGESEVDATSAAVYRVVIGPKPPPVRITLGYAAIAAARQVWVLASGAGKEQALRESLLPAGKTPLARVLRARPDTTIFTDIPQPG